MITVADLAQRYNLQPQRSGDHLEYIGRNPWENGATEDGFSLIEGGQWHGTAIDRKLNYKRYKSHEVARLSEVAYADYEGSLSHPGGIKEHNGHVNGNSNNGVNSKPMSSPLREVPPEPEALPVVAPFLPVKVQYDTRSLQERGVNNTTLQHFRVHSHSGGDSPKSWGAHWKFPTYHADGTEGRWRTKFRYPERQLQVNPKKKPVKCLWAEAGKDKGEPPGYNLHGVLGAVDVWLVNSELAVWLWWQEGLPAICPLGEGRKVDSFIRMFTPLQEAGTKRICILLDNDKKGKDGAVNAFDAAVSLGLEVVVFDLTPTAKPGFDASDLHECYMRGDLNVADNVTPPFPEILWSQSVADLNKIGQWRRGVHIVEQAEESVALDKEANAKLDTLGRALSKTVRVCPSCQKKSIIKNRFKGGWICYTKMGGCGEAFPDGTLEIEAQEVEEKAKATKDDRVTELFNMVRGHQLFYTHDGEFIVVEQNGKRITHRIASDGFALWCRYLYLRHKDALLSLENVSQVVQSLRALCRIEGVEMPAFVRTASHGGKIYIDLCNSEFEAVEVDASGWRIVTDYPIFFRRPEGMQEIPKPAPGDNATVWKEFGDLLNVGDERNYALIVSWLCFALVPPTEDVDCPILSVHGQQGSAKTTLCRIVRQTVDPNDGYMVTYVREERDVVTAAENARVFCLDNQTVIPGWLNSLLASMVTGGPHRCRQLFHDDGSERFFKGQPALIINGIPPTIGELDLNDRALKLNLPSLEDNYRSKREVMEHWHGLRPVLFSAILDAMVVGLRNRDAASQWLKGKKLPRMTDYMIWSVACEGLFPGAAPGAFPSFSEPFYDVYWSNIAAAAEESLDDPLIQAVLSFLDKRKTYKGMAAPLFASLVEEAVSNLIDWDAYNSLAQNEWNEQRRMKDDARKQLAANKGFPTHAKHCGLRLRQIAPILRRVGVVLRSKPTNKGTEWLIFRIEDEAAATAIEAAEINPTADLDLWGDTE